MTLASEVIDSMSVQELFMLARCELTEAGRHYVVDVVLGKADMCGRILDSLHGIDPYKQTKSSPAMGTANKRSYTAKVRKAVGYSYP